jgi:hypothetical protein
MKIHYYNNDNRNVDFRNDFYCIRPNMVLADKAIYCSISALQLLNYIEINEFSEEMLIEFIRIVFDKDDSILNHQERLRMLFSEIKQLRKLKHKNTAELVQINKFKSLISELRKLSKEKLEMNLKKYILFDLIPFVENKDLEVDWPDFNLNPDSEDKLVKAIRDVITEDNGIL